ncbi:MAG: hypothetical protein JW801_08470 [Bacteroidales bacterium]|nr:hypothetical protein [Bacteroidales bacterium]
MGKKRIIKKFEQLSDELLALIRQEYPDGFDDNLITFQTPTGELASGLTLETDDTYYLIRMPKSALPADDEEDDSSGDNSDGQNFESLENLQIADDMSDEDDE